MLCDTIEVVWNGYRWEVTMYSEGKMLMENEEIENVIIPTDRVIGIKGNESGGLFIEGNKIILQSPEKQSYRVCISEDELCINMVEGMEE